MKFERFVAKRYLKSRKSNKILSFISGISILGILLGVATLIVVVSVMSGFFRQPEKPYFGCERSYRGEPCGCHAHR